MANQEETPATGGLSRRGFLGTGLLGGIGIAAARPLRAAETEAPLQPKAPAGEWTLNGQTFPIEAGPDEVLVDTLRSRQGLCGTRRSCGQGACGACTVLVDGVPTLSCLLPSVAVAGQSVRTIEDIGKETLHPIQRAMMACEGLQCGFCTPGFVVGGVAFFESWRAKHGKTRPPRSEIADALEGHLCRCGAHAGIIEAMAQACEGRHDAADPPHERVDAREKVTGAARYTVDVQLPGQLEAALFRSPLASGTLRTLDLTAAAAHPGVKGVLSLAEPGAKIRFVGQELAAIAAVDLESARGALAKVRFEAEPSPAVFGLEAARKEGAPMVFPNKKAARTEAFNSSEGEILPAALAGNVRGPLKLPGGDPNQVGPAIEAAKYKYEASFRTQTHSHAVLEPHVAVAQWTPEGALEVWASTQSVSDLADDLAEKFELDRSQVRVQVSHIGGAFGAKNGHQMEVEVAAQLAKVVGAPVRLAFSRPEELAYGGLRPGVSLHLELGATAEGRLAGVRAKAWTDGGVSVGGVSANLYRILYEGPRDLADWDVVSHTPPCKPMRGPGGPQAMWALEQGIDRLAAQMGEDPLAVRLRWDQHPHRPRLIKTAQQLPRWRARRQGPDTGRFRRGIGAAAGVWPGFMEPGVSVELEADGSGFRLKTACQDLGQGTRTVLANAVAEVLRVDPHSIKVELGNSDFPHGCGSAGSRTTPSMGPTATDAAEQLHAILVENAELRLGLSGLEPAPGGLESAGRRVTWPEILASGPPIRVMGRRRKDPEGYFFPFVAMGYRIFRHTCATLQLTEVEVDTHTGVVRPLWTWSGAAIGRLHAPALAASQLSGGVIQGLSYALYEERRLDMNTGRTTTTHLDHYRLLGIGDAPEMELHFDEEGWEGVLGGGIGLSEACTIPVAASLANAVFHATGWSPTESPIRPDRVLRGIA